jgi:hypothetical protein
LELASSGRVQRSTLFGAVWRVERWHQIEAAAAAVAAVAVAVAVARSVLNAKEAVAREGEASYLQ